MLRQTFCHVPGIGLKAEERLWASGAVSLDSVEPAAAALGARRRERLVQHLEESQRHLAVKNSAFFAETMPASEHWRLYNIRDVFNLEALLVKAYNLTAAQTPFGPSVTMPLPPPPPERFQAHAPTIQRLMRRYAPFGF